jgi:hypothetical protein
MKQDHVEARSLLRPPSIFEYRKAPRIMLGAFVCTLSLQCLAVTIVAMVVVTIVAVMVRTMVVMATLGPYADHHLGRSRNDGSRQHETCNNSHQESHQLGFHFLSSSNPVLVLVANRRMPHSPEEVVWGKVSMGNETDLTLPASWRVECRPEFQSQLQLW